MESNSTKQAVALNEDQLGRTLTVETALLDFTNEELPDAEAWSSNYAAAVVAQQEEEREEEPGFFFQKFRAGLITCWLVELGLATT